MNWSLGFFRLWMACSLAWLAFVGWYICTALQPYEMTHSPIPEEIEVCKKAAENPFYCFDPIVSMVTPQLPFGQWVSIVAFALVPPVLALAVSWVLR